MADLTEAGRQLREHFDLSIPPLAQVRRRAARSRRRRVGAAGAAVLVVGVGVATTVGLVHRSQPPTKVVAGEPPANNTGAILLRPVNCQLPAASPTALSKTVSVATCADRDSAGIATSTPQTENARRAVIMSAVGTSTRFVLGPADRGIISDSNVRVVPDGRGGFVVRIELTGAGVATLLPYHEQPYGSIPRPASLRALEALEVQGSVAAVIDLPFGSRPTGILDAIAPAGRPFTRQEAEQLSHLIATQRQQGRTP